MTAAIILIIQNKYRLVDYYIQKYRSLIHTRMISNKNNKIGNHTIIFYKTHIINSLRGGVKIGDNCVIGRTDFHYHAGMPFYTSLLNDGVNSHIYIGNNCRINGAYIHAEDFVEIGNNCIFASGVSIMDSNGHPLNSRNRTIGRDTPQGIVIGDNVWIGINSVVLKNSKIGDNCVISAGSIVKGHFPNDCIIKGNPAAVVGKVNSNIIES